MSALKRSSSHQNGSNEAVSTGESSRSGSIASEAAPQPSKRVRLSTPPPRSPKSASSKTGQSIHDWLHPDAKPLLHVHSPPLHASSSTFLAFAIAFEPPAHITNVDSLSKEVRRIVRELDVPSIVGPLAMKGSEGAFQNGEGRRKLGKGKERAREPDHRMWGCRAVVLRDGCDGTKGEDDYQLLETYNDDGEKFGGERVLRVLKENQGVDVISICCRWYGGDMLGPIRFQHIGLTAQTSLLDLQKQVTLRDLRSTLDDLDGEISRMRATLNPPGSPLRSLPTSQLSQGDEDEDGDGKVKVSPYDKVTDLVKLRRLVAAREKSRESLEQRSAWVAMEQAKVAGSGVG